MCAICMVSMTVSLHATHLILMWSKISNIRSVVRILLVHATVAVSSCYYIRRVKLVNLMEKLALPYMVCWKEQ